MLLDEDMLDKTLEFAPRERLISSYIATGIENAPIFVKAENTEKSAHSKTPQPASPNILPSQQQRIRNSLFFVSLQPAFQSLRKGGNSHRERLEPSAKKAFRSIAKEG